MYVLLRDWPTFLAQVSHSSGNDLPEATKAKARRNVFLACSELTVTLILAITAYHQGRCATPNRVVVLDLNTARLVKNRGVLLMMVPHPGAVSLLEPGQDLLERVDDCCGGVVVEVFKLVSALVDLGQHLLCLVGSFRFSVGWVRVGVLVGADDVLHFSDAVFGG